MCVLGEKSRQAASHGISCPCCLSPETQKASSPHPHTPSIILWFPSVMKIYVNRMQIQLGTGTKEPISENSASGREERDFGGQRYRCGFRGYL